MSHDLLRCASEAEWLDARRETIGASEAAAILGVSPYESPLSLYLRKLGLTAPDDGNRQLFRIGHLVEPVIARLYIEDRPEERSVIAPVPFALYRNPEFPEWMTCTPDRLIVRGLDEDAVTDAPLELKNVDWRWGKLWVEEPPLGYVVQLQHQMAVLGTNTGVMAALVGGNSFRWVELQRDDEFIDRVLVPALAKFRWHLETQTPPEADETEATREAIRRAYPAHVPNKVVALPGALIEWDEKRRSAIKAIKELEGMKREAESRIALALADAERGELPNGVAYSNKLQTRKESVVKASSFRVLRRHGNGDDD